MFDYHSLGPSIGEREIVLERQFNAPRLLLFEVFTRPEHLKRWWAPPPYTLPICTIDLRPGGIWHYCMRSPEGQEQWARSVYREIVPPERLVYTTTFADEHANPTSRMPEHLTTVLFTEEDGKTRVTTRSQFSGAQALKVAVDIGMPQGMAITWACLVEYVQELRGSL
jgi:uncharacterized protein YndB with AHSA1/START domain